MKFLKSLLVFTSLLSLDGWSMVPWKLDLELVQPLHFSFNSNSTATLSLLKCNLQVVDTWGAPPSCYTSEGVLFNGLTYVYKGAPGTTKELPYSIQVAGHYSSQLNHTAMSPRLRGNETIITNCDAQSLVATGYFRVAKAPISIPTDAQGTLTLPMPTDKMAQLLINKVNPQTERCKIDAKYADPEDLEMPAFVISDDPQSRYARDLELAISRSFIPISNAPVEN